MGRETIFCQRCGRRMPAGSYECPRCGAPVHGPSGRGFKGRASSRYVLATVFMFFAMGFLIGSIFAPWYTIEGPSPRDEYSDYVVNHEADEPVRSWSDYDDDAVADLYLTFVNLIYAAAGIAGLAFLLMLGSGFTRERSDGLERLIMLLMVLGIVVPLAGAGYYYSAHIDAYDEKIDLDSDGPWESFSGKDGDLEWYPNAAFYLFIAGGCASILALFTFRSASRMDRALTRGPRDRGRHAEPSGGRRDRHPRDDRPRDDRRYREERYDDRYRDDRGYDRDHRDDRDNRYDRDHRDDRGYRGDRRYDDRGRGRGGRRGDDRSDDDSGRDRRRPDAEFDRGTDVRDRGPRDDRGTYREPEPRSDGSDGRKWYDEPERERPRRSELPPRHDLRK